MANATDTKLAGHAIRVMRTAQKLSLRELGALSGTGPAYISQVERGERIPSERWLRAVTEALAKNLGNAA